MAGSTTTSWWEAPKFSFSAANQVDEWKTFYVRALNYLETLDIDIEALNQTKKGWKQVKMMLTSEDWKVLQTPLDNGVTSRWKYHSYR